MKLKNWTALTAVKIASFLLILICCFLILDYAYAALVRGDETGIYADVVFTNAATNQHFFDKHMPEVYCAAMTVLYYKSEAAIIEGAYLAWFDYDGGHSLRSPDGSHVYADIEAFPTDGFYYHGEFYIYGDDRLPIIVEDSLSQENERRAQVEQNAIQQQLYEFRAAEDILAKADGLIYRLSDSDEVIYGSLAADSVWFKAQPVYLIASSNGSSTRWESSQDRVEYGNYWFYTPYEWTLSQTGYEVCLAFNVNAVTAHNNTLNDMRSMYIEAFAVIAVSALLILLLAAVLLAGAGRRHGLEGVHYAVIDKPFLDISLALVACWFVAGAFVASELFRYFTRHGSYTAMQFMFMVLPVVMLSPVLLWLMSLAKRMKARGWWKHTLVWFIPSRLWRLCKSLWAGAKLTAKVAMISFAAFCIFIIMGSIGAAFRYDAFPMLLVGLLFTAFVAFFLLLYARRIRTLEKAAKEISDGTYSFGTPIDVGGGELGSIAGSINNISAGINTAVEERMKSERLKTELITNVSHDIRTPLTSIITYTDLLKSEGLDCEKAPEYLDVLVQKSQRLKTLTDDLFEAAKAATGNIDVNLSELDIVSLINQVLGELDSAVKASGLDLRLNLPERLQVRADGKLMWRVMENLLTNALKYSLPGSRVYLGIAPDGKWARIDLKNVSAAELSADPAELIERFKRGDDSRTDGGSGLGLSIVQSFVAAQGGLFSVSADGDLFKAAVWVPMV